MSVVTEKKTHLSFSYKMHLARTYDDSKNIQKRNMVQFIHLIFFFFNQRVMYENTITNAKKKKNYGCET